jgi:hypothetical protein
MAFITIPDSIITIGKAITRTLWKTYVKDNLDDLDTRVSGVEGSLNKIEVFNDLVTYNKFDSDLDGIEYFRVSSAFTLTDAKIAMFVKGSLTGTLEIDVQKASSTDFTSSVSVFTTKPSLTAANYAVSSNAVFDGTNKVLAAGDYLRLDLTSVLTGARFDQFTVYLIGEV